jgi:DNA-binding PadR family transcriptional regulator
VLALLLERPMHGYEMIQELDSRTGGIWRPSPGSIYPTLQLLEDEGLIVADESGSRRRFTLTEAGQAEAAQSAEAAPWNDFGDDNVSQAQEYRDAIFGIMNALRQVGFSGTDEQRARALDVLTETRRKLYAILADDASYVRSAGLVFMQNTLPSGSVSTTQPWPRPRRSSTTVARGPRPARPPRRGCGRPSAARMSRSRFHGDPRVQSRVDCPHETLALGRYRGPDRRVPRAERGDGHRDRTPGRADRPRSGHETVDEDRRPDAQVRPGVDGVRVLVGDDALPVFVRVRELGAVERRQQPYRCRCRRVGSRCVGQVVERAASVGLHNLQ